MSPNNKPKSIVLWLIVKNEVNVIERCLASVRPLIDAWCIVDTGSTDGTQALIRNAMADMPGELHERPWVNFGHNRTEAIQLARPWGDYALAIDADEVIEFDPALDIDAMKRSLSADWYFIDFKLGNIVYPRAGLASNSFRWHYRAAMHEFLEALDTVEPAQRLAGLNYAHGPGGARSTDPDKYAKDAIVIEQALTTETDPMMLSRYSYYLGQSYRDSGQHDKAIDTWEKRSAMGGYPEETAVALTNSGHLRSARHDRFEVVLDSYVRAWEASPQRAEPLYYAAKWCRDNERIRTAYLFARQARTIPRPASGLFLEPYVYDWGIAVEFSIAAWYAGDFVAGLQCCFEILGSPEVPEAELVAVRSNINHYRRSLGLLG